MPVKSPQVLQFVKDFLQKVETFAAIVNKAAGSDRFDVLLYAQDDEDQSKSFNNILMREIVEKFLAPKLPPVSIKGVRKMIFFIDLYLYALAQSFQARVHSLHKPTYCAVEHKGFAGCLLTD